MVCLEMLPRQQSFCQIFRYILHSMAKKITFLKGYFWIINVSLMFYTFFLWPYRKISKCTLIRDGVCVEVCHVLNQFYLPQQIHDPDSAMQIASKD